ncbi:DUF4404 family protein [Streptomyces sp. NPDC006544]|uniref:DUF4404 family protein n=1 Tax=Streptomyces sp. NPDC006544 TaxID=3154583 RepID=UPI0033AD6748
MQLMTLREQLEQGPPLSLEEREQLHELVRNIEADIEVESTTRRNSLVDRVDRAVERLGIDRPDLAGTLGNISVSLANMEI